MIIVQESCKILYERIILASCFSIVRQQRLCILGRYGAIEIVLLLLYSKIVLVF